ncbi:MAG TPA: transglutaminase N-terminal domain-containing protein, partial [Devosia sp.]|nr:transglutaminase N-terminal domain-containing protein [Devosia sp.]
MKLAVTHTLTCHIPAPPRAVQHLLLTAVSTPQQRVERWSVEMPGFADAATFRDAYGNRAHLVSQAKPGERLVIKVSGLVETTDKAGVLGRLDYDPPPAIFRRTTSSTAADEDLLEGLD